MIVEDETVFVDTLTEDEKDEIYMTIIELAEEYLEEESVKMASVSFNDDFYADVTHILFQQLIENGLCQNDDYDDLYDIVSEVLASHFNEFPPYVSDYCPIVSVPLSPSKIQALKDQPQPVQRTPEWYAFRQGVITASNIGKIFISDAQLNSFIYEKCKNADIPPQMGGYVNTESSLHWGVKYEPLTSMLYEFRNKTIVGEFGCIRHPIHAFLAASPDGINVAPESPLYGRMIEIKNIVNREIDGVPSLLYWVQMQIQMECCDLDECDFVETRFKEYATAEEFYADDTKSLEGGEKGAIIAFISNIDGSLVYKYLPIGQEVPGNTDLEDWVNLTERYIPENTRMKSIAFWYLDEYSCVLIKRNRHWFQSAFPKIQETWDIIQREKVEGFEHRAPKKKPQKPAATGLLIQLGEDGDSHVIQNMPVTHPYSIVKTDL
jgi:putative phage-type endonuclease